MLTKQASSTIHLRHPASGVPMMDEHTGEPVTVTLFVARDGAEIAALNARARALGFDVPELPPKENDR